MLVTISNDSTSMTVEGKITYSTRIHNPSRVRTLAGAGYTFNNGSYRIIQLNIAYLEKKDIFKLENMMLSSVLDIKTEVGENFYKVACVNETFEYQDENETQVSLNLTFETNILNNIKY